MGPLRRCQLSAMGPSIREVLWAEGPLQDLQHLAREPLCLGQLPVLVQSGGKARRLWPWP